MAYNGEDLESIYDEKIFPLMSEIIAVCKEHNMPVVASFQYGEDNFVTTAILPEGCAKSFEQARDVLYKPSAPMLMLTTRNGDGRTTVEIIAS